MSSRIVIQSEQNDHVSIQTVREFEQCITESRDWTFQSAFSSVRIERKLPLDRKLRLTALRKRINRNEDSFFVLMNIGHAYSRYYPQVYYSFTSKSFYLFDAWESMFPNIIETINDLRPSHLFVTAKQSADFLSKCFKNTQVHWIPEGIKSDVFQFETFDKKSTDVLNFGRRYDWYFECVNSYCAHNNISFLCQKQPGEILFPEKADFIKELAKAKISICVPGSITHPERSGTISTLTQRYLQSMLAKCLIVGHCPYDLELLFGYNPVIEIDRENPQEQLKSILNNYKSYHKLIEKNYDEVMQRHLWKHRISAMEAIWRGDG